MEFASRQDFRERIDLICQLLGREGPDAAPTTRYQKAWRQVRGLLPWRNQIAHSPFGGFERRDAQGLVERLFGVLKVRKGRLVPEDVIGIEKIGELIESTWKLIKTLEEPVQGNVSDRPGW